MNSRTIKLGLKTAERTYQGARNSIPDFVRDHTPNNFAAFLVFAISLTVPEVGALFFLSYIITLVSNNRVPNLSSKIINYYDQLLTDDQNQPQTPPALPLAENQRQPMTQSALLNSSFNYLGNVGNVVTAFLPIELIFFNNLLTYLSDGKVPAIKDLITSQVYKSILGSETAFSVQNKDGACFGMLMNWYVYLLANKKNHYFKSLQNIITQTLINAKLIENETKLLEQISQAQYNQVASVRLNVDGKEIIISRSKEKQIFSLLDKTQDVDTFLQRIVNAALDQALANKRKLIGIVIEKPGVGNHIIGVIAYGEPGNVTWNYFDANHMISEDFRQRKMITQALWNLLRIGYQDFLTNVLGEVCLETYSSNQPEIELNQRSSFRLTAQQEIPRNLITTSFAERQYSFLHEMYRKYQYEQRARVSTRALYQPK